MLILVLFGAAAAVWQALMGGWHWLGSNADQVNCLVLLATAVVVFYYTLQTRLLRLQGREQLDGLEEQIRISRDSALFSALAIVHERLNRPESCARRKYLYNMFRTDLAAGASATLRGDLVAFLPDGRLKCMLLLRDLDGSIDTLRKFNKHLEGRPSGIPDINALDAVEGALRDLDIIAIPFFEGVKPAIAAAEAYKPIISKTAGELLPFVVIHKKLRGSTDPNYKRDYLHMLLKMEILAELAPGLGVTVAGLRDDLGIPAEGRG